MRFLKWMDRTTPARRREAVMGSGGPRTSGKHEYDRFTGGEQFARLNHDLPSRESRSSSWEWDYSVEPVSDRPMDEPVAGRHSQVPPGG